MDFHFKQNTTAVARQEWSAHPKGAEGNPLCGFQSIRSAKEITKEKTKAAPRPLLPHRGLCGPLSHNHFLSIINDSPSTHPST